MLALVYRSFTDSTLPYSPFNGQSLCGSHSTFIVPQCAAIAVNRYPKKFGKFFPAIFISKNIFYSSLHYSFIIRASLANKKYFSREVGKIFPNFFGPSVDSASPGGPTTVGTQPLQRDWLVHWNPNKKASNPYHFPIYKLDAEGCEESNIQEIDWSASGGKIKNSLAPLPNPLRGWYRL